MFKYLYFECDWSFKVIAFIPTIAFFQEIDEIKKEIGVGIIVFGLKIAVIYERYVGE